MNNKSRRWEVLFDHKKKGKLGLKKIEKVLLANRGIKSVKERKEFFNPADPIKISLTSLGINKDQVAKAVKRILKAKKTKELVIVYGDYDADGICGTAVLWERLHSLKLNVLPYIPERFSEGYGLNSQSLKKLKAEHPDLGLIITVDHGIVAGTKVEIAKKLGIDIIISDHHEPGKRRPKAFAVIHTTKIGGAAVAWILSREIKRVRSGLELVAIGTIADQLQLIGANRSFAKWGLKELNVTERPGLNALYEEAGILKGEIGPYEVGFLIAPRINAMGRLVHAIDSLRLLCYTNKEKVKELARLLNRTNLERQRIVEEVVVKAREGVGKEEGIIILAHESYHEGVIGLAAAKLVEEFYRPAIVISTKGDIAKASARSISGFNIIETIRKVEGYLLEGGGHPMAAGFSIETAKIDGFRKEMNKISKSLLTEDILTRRLRIDLAVPFSDLGEKLLALVKSFEPTGLGNPAPTFTTKQVRALDARKVGGDGKHLKLKLGQGSILFEGIGFSLGEKYQELSPEKKVDIVYNLEENLFNGRRSLQLKIKDLRLSH